MSAKKSSKPIYGKIVKVVWIAFIFFAVMVPLYIFSVSINFMGLYGDLPGIRALENSQNENDLSSELYSSDNVSLGKYFRVNRSHADFEELSPDLVNTLLASEDHRFENHSGIDMLGLARVGVKSILFGNRQEGGGSTLTQQLAKNLFKTRSEKYDGPLNRVPILGIVIDKTQEWIVAVRLERAFTKKEIISLYLNTVDFGSNAFGIKVASQTFFNTTPDSLTYTQSAVLVGLLQAPSRFNPYRNPDNSIAKRNQVLTKLHRNEFINKTTLDSLQKLPLTLDYNVENHNQGLATYFRSVIRNFLYKWSDEHGYDLDEDGLKIYTTIDSRMQAYAEESVAEHMSKLQETFYEHWNGRNPWIDDDFKEIPNFLENAAKKTHRYKNLVQRYGDGNDSIDIVMNTPVNMTVFSWEGEKDTVLSPIDSIKYYKHFLQAGFMAMDPHTGQIKAWVGGIDHKYFKYDHVMQGKRQPGSTFKPFLYAAAIEAGYHPCYEAVDALMTYPTGGDPPTWTPQNSEGEFSGERMTLRQALAQSKNSIAAFLTNKLGPKTVVDMAHRLGIKSHIEPVMSLALGSSDVSVYEMVGAYSTFVNEGTWIEPYYITRIEDKNGQVIQEFPPRTVEAINEETAYLMLHMLKGATQLEGGSALGLHRPEYELFGEGMEIAAKTGTSQNASDGWFMGVTKDLAGGAWVGGDERSIRFRNWYAGQGSKTALPIWANFMKKVYKDPTLGYEKGPFKMPSRPLSIEIDCDKYMGIDVESDSLDIEIEVDNEIDPGQIF